MREQYRKAKSEETHWQREKKRELGEREMQTSAREARKLRDR
jgi:hypothetical protein